jgi:hypothetical protein
MCIFYNFFQRFMVPGAVWRTLTDTFGWQKQCCRIKGPHPHLLLLLLLTAAHLPQGNSRAAMLTIVTSRSHLVLLLLLLLAVHLPQSDSSATVLTRQIVQHVRTTTQRYTH